MAAAEPKRRSWTSKYIPRPGSSGGRQSSKLAITIGGQPGGTASKFKEPLVPLATPVEGQELVITSAYTTPAASQRASPTSSTVALPPVNGGGASDPPSSTFSSDPPPVSRPTTPRRWSLTPLSSPKNSPQQELDNQASQLILNALERTNSAQQSGRNSEPRSSGFGKMSFSSMMGGLSSLSLSRTSTNTSTVDEKDALSSRGRSMFSTKRVKSASQVPIDDNGVENSNETSRSRSRARSQSPFMFRRFRQRESSPTPQPLPMAHSDVELSDSSSYVRPRTAFTDDPDSGDETVGETEDEEDSLASDEEEMDPVTERNTEANALIAPVPCEGPTGFDGEADIDPDPLGEGVNVVVPPEPYFPTTLNYTPGLVGAARAKRNPRRRKSVKNHEPLHYETSRPVFQRDRCTITITQGDPDSKLGDRRRRRYVVASDLSEESRYAVEWGIGTVLRDGDEMFIVNVAENESRIDPPLPNAADRANKLRSQQERQGLAYILVRQATSLLQRTKLNVVVSCQAWHAKNARHMLLDIVDFVEPVMLIVGSRGLGQLKGILLGSTSHYLIEKSPVPVMIARRRLKRPPRRSAHLSKHRAHVSLAEAGIDRVAAKVDQDVKVMRDAIQRDDDRRDGGPGSREMPGTMSGVAEDQEVEGEDDEDVEETGVTNSPVDVKVSG